MRPALLFSAPAKRRLRRRTVSKENARPGGSRRQRLERSRRTHEFADFWQKRLAIRQLSDSHRRNAGCTMRHCCAVVLSAALVIVAADPALARTKSKSRPQCADRPQDFSWNFLIPGQPAPQPNGCAPPVYNYGRYIGQDPDPNIRLQLMRDPANGIFAAIEKGRYVSARGQCRTRPLLPAPT